MRKVTFESKKYMSRKSRREGRDLMVVQTLLIDHAPQQEVQHRC